MQSRSCGTSNTSVDVQIEDTLSIKKWARFMIQAQNKLGPNLGGAGMSSLAIPPPAAPSPPGLPHGLQTHPTQRHARLYPETGPTLPRDMPDCPEEMSVFTQGDARLYPRRCPSLPKEMSVFTQGDVRLYPRRCPSLPKEMSIFTQRHVRLYPRRSLFTRAFRHTLPKDLVLSPAGCIPEGCRRLPITPSEPLCVW